MTELAQEDQDLEVDAEICAQTSSFSSTLFFCVLSFILL